MKQTEKQGLLLAGGPVFLWENGMESQENERL